METKTERLYPSVPLLENIDLEKRLEKKINDVNSFNNHVNNIKEMITYFKDKNQKSTKRYKNYKTLNTILESVDSIVIIAATSTSITLSSTGIRLILLPISAGIACGLSLGNKILHKLIINKYNKYKKLYERDQNTIKSFDKLYRKVYKIILLMKMNMKIFVIFLLDMLTKIKTNLFYKHEYKNKINFF